MSRIKSKNSKPELIVRKFLFAKGIRYRLHDKNLPGKPDIVLPKYRKVIFVNGCFWHGHKGCKYYVVPSTRTDWWLAKIEKNKKKDLECYFSLEEKGWSIKIVWECELKLSIRENTLNNILFFVKSENSGN